MRQRSPPIDSLSPQRALPRILLAILFFPIGTIMVLAGISTKATAASNSSLEPVPPPTRG